MFFIVLNVNSSSMPVLFIHLQCQFSFGAWKEKGKSNFTIEAGRCWFLGQPWEETGNYFHVLLQMGIYWPNRHVLMWWFGWSRKYGIKKRLVHICPPPTDRLWNPKVSERGCVDFSRPPKSPTQTTYAWPDPTSRNWRPNWRLWKGRRNKRLNERDNQIEIPKLCLEKCILII